MKFYLIISFLIGVNCAFCQTNNLRTSKIDSIAASIDSLKNYGSSIEDGTIEIKRKGIIKKIFTKKVVGSFSNNYFSNRKTKRLVKVIYEQELGNPKRISYYFNNDTLILVKTLTWDGTVADKVLSSGQFYFLRDSLIKRTGIDSLAKPEFMIKHAKEFIKDWRDMQNIRLGNR
jgi:hypothetical protein